MPTIAGASEKWAGKFFDKGGMIYNVLHPDFGAKANGTDDDTGPVQAALEFADPNGSNPGVVYLAPRPGGPTIYSISNLVLPSYSTIVGPGWQQVFMRARGGTTGYMITDDGDAVGIRLVGFGVDGNNVAGLNGIRVGYAGTGATSWNHGAFLKDIRTQRCPGISIDVQANVAELEDVWASQGNGTGIRLAGIAVRGSRIASEGSTAAELQISADACHLTDVHIETALNKPVQFLAGAEGGVINGLSITVDAATTIETLIEFAATAFGNSVQDIFVNLDAAGSDYTNLISDLQASFTKTGASLGVGKRYGGSYWQQASTPVWFGAPDSREGYLVDGVQVVGSQGAAVADATDAGSAITQVNAVLARLRAHGLIAT